MSDARRTGRAGFPGGPLASSPRIRHNCGLPVMSTRLSTGALVFRATSAIAPVPNAEIEGDLNRTSPRSRAISTAHQYSICDFREST
eukprot:6890251-Pyramimonas_sp.AAC.1